MSSDRWCPNCQQAVRPRERYGPGAWGIGIAIWLASGLVYRALGWFEDWLGIASAVTAVVLAPQLSERYKVRTCPICGTDRLGETAELPSGADAAGGEQQSAASRVGYALGQGLAWIVLLPVRIIVGALTLILSPLAARGRSARSS